MVKVAIFAFLIGLSVYQGFTWTRGLDASAGVGDSRNVFITFMAGMGLCFVFFLFTFAIKNIETLVRTGRTRWTIPEESISGQGDPIEHEHRGALTDRMPAVSQANPASHPRLSADKRTFNVQRQTAKWLLSMPASLTPVLTLRCKFHGIFFPLKKAIGYYRIYLHS